MKNNLFLIVLINSLFSCSAEGQNGKLISETQIVFPDSVQEQLNNISVFQEIQSNAITSQITYLSDGLKINGYISKPIKSGDYPVIIFNRGGNRDFGALNDRTATYILGTMAQWGYVVIASNYRGGGGSEGMEEFGGEEMNDIMNLIPLLEEVKEADTSRIGVYGFSRGGMMTYMLLRETCKFKAAAVGAGSSNLLKWIDKRPEMEEVYSELIRNYEDNKEAELINRSAYYWADELCKTTPLLIAHGSADWRVTPENGLEMVSKLYELKHPVRFLFLEGADHGMTEYRSLLWNQIKEFFNHYLKEENPLPNMEPHGR